LTRIAKLHELHDWPAVEQVNLLSEFAAGHLGWAALAVRWIGREVEWKGESPYIRQLVFDQVKDVRKGDLYDLYAFILARVVPDAAGEAEKVGCERALGTLAVLESPQTITTITSLLPFEDTFNVLHFFRRMSSIIVSGLEVVDSQTVPRPHKSFLDWICSANAELRFRVDAELHHSRLSKRCLSILRTSLHFNMANLETSDPLILFEKYGIDIDATRIAPPLWDEIDTSVVYSCKALFHHIAKAGQLDDAMLSELSFFSKNLFLSWAEVASTVSSVWETLFEPLKIVCNLISVCRQNLVGFQYSCFFNI
jgi:hypothetical protein